MTEIALKDPGYPGDFISYSEHKECCPWRPLYNIALSLYVSELQIHFLSRLDREKIRSRTGLFGLFKTKRSSFPGEFRADVCVRTIHMLRFHMP